ncbi:MAG: antibiotic biosynthesis monooxygenase [Verrucomicrobia bacterium]|jgi:quinol monooxygenase YgiN|nr:antibiotic biosynthesis monooxygenase [Verrucomicrobiota bacterium]
MNTQVVVVETVKAVQGKKSELKRALSKLVPMSRKAPGCLQYDLLEPVDASDEFLVLMRWEKLSDLRNHERSNYIDEFVRDYDKVLYDEVKVTVWSQLEVNDSFKG